MRDALRPAAIAGLCILALALAAATLTTPVETGDPGFGGDGSGDRNGIDDSGEVDGGDPGAVNVSGSVDAPAIGWCVEPLLEVPAGLGLLVVLFGVALAVRALRGLPVALLTVSVVVWPLLVGYLLLTAGCETGTVSAETAVFGGAPPEPPVGSGNGDGGGQPVAAPTVAVAAFLLLAIAGAAVAFLTGDGGDEEDPDAEEPTTDPERRAEIGSVAGEAADRIEEDADLGNEVYRAWAEMTDALDVEDPETSTTAEFAEAAIEAGLDRGDVAELTELFEAVRYGTAAATPSRERRAIAALRSIERQYGDDDVEGATDGGADAGGPADGAGDAGGPGDRGGDRGDGNG